MNNKTIKSSDTNRTVAAETLADSPLAAASPWVDRHGLAKHYTVSVRTADGWKAENRVPFRKVGRRVFFNLDSVEAALAAYDVKAKR